MGSYHCHNGLNDLYQREWHQRKSFCFFVLFFLLLEKCVTPHSLFFCRYETTQVGYLKGQNEPRHDKTNKRRVRPAKTQISLGIRQVWSEASLCAQWVAKDPSFLHADSGDADPPWLIWVFAGRTAILLVLSCRGSNKYVVPKDLSVFARIIVSKRRYVKAMRTESIIIKNWLRNSCKKRTCIFKGGGQNGFPRNISDLLIGHSEFVSFRWNTDTSIGQNQVQSWVIQLPKVTLIIICQVMQTALSLELCPISNLVSIKHRLPVRMIYYSQYKTQTKV